MGTDYTFKAIFFRDLSHKGVYRKRVIFDTFAFPKSNILNLCSLLSISLSRDNDNRISHFRFISDSFLLEY